MGAAGAFCYLRRCAELAVTQRSQTETNDVAVPEPGDSEHDAEKRQQHAEDDEGFAACDRRDEPVEVHPEKAGERSDGQEDQGHEC